MVQQLLFYSLCEMCPNTEFFWSVFPRIRTEYGPEKTLYLDTFHAVIALGILNSTKIKQILPLAEKTSVFLNTAYSKLMKIRFYLKTFE